MEQITITPANKELSVKLKAMQLVNDFTSLGFGSRGAFLAIVKHYQTKYVDQQASIRLSNWFYGRVICEDMNNEIETVLNKLRHE